MEILNSEAGGMETIGSDTNEMPLPILNFAADRDGERSSGTDEADRDYHTPGEEYDEDYPHEYIGFAD